MMRPPDSGIEVFVCVEPVDFRKQIDGLAAIVQEELALNAFGGQLFVFTNRRRDRVKCLYWERCGFVLWMKRHIASTNEIGRPLHSVTSGRSFNATAFRLYSAIFDNADSLIGA